MVLMKRCFQLFSVLWCLLWPSHALPQNEIAWNTRGEEIVRLVKDRFFDPKLANSWAKEHTGYAHDVKSEEQFVALTRKALEELRASHTGYFTEQDQKRYGLLAIFAPVFKLDPVEWNSIGADFTADNFVRTVFAEGPAAMAGLRRGDRVLTLNGAPFSPVASLRERAGQTVVLTVQRRADQPPITLKVTPRHIGVKQEWLEAEEKGARLIKRNGKSVAYVPLFTGAGEEYQTALQTLISTQLRDADALILDLRNGFGGCDPQLVNLFNPTPAALTYLDRDGKQTQYDPRWRKPLFVLINEGSTSGKEVVAYSIRKHHLGTLVGEPTAGAVLAGRCFLLSDRSLLYLAVSDIRVDGQRLEGKRIAPDVTVKDNLPYANDADPQLEKAIELATHKK